MMHGLSCSTACGNLPRPGLKPVSPALAGRFLTSAPPGKSFSGPFKKPPQSMYWWQSGDGFFKNVTQSPVSCLDKCLNKRRSFATVLLICSCSLDSQLSSSLEEEVLVSEEDTGSQSIPPPHPRPCTGKRAAQKPKPQPHFRGQALPSVLGEAVLEVGSTLSWAKSKCFPFVLKSSRIITGISLSLASSAPSLPPPGPFQFLFEWCSGLFANQSTLDIRDSR